MAQLAMVASVAPDDALLDLAETLRGRLAELPQDLRVATLNAVREVIAQASPFAAEPVDRVTWVPVELVEANDYNPNSVAPPEMLLLEHSVVEDGFTQPIVAWEREDGYFEVVDGFHRNRVGRESSAVAERIKGYLPLAVIRADREDRGDRIAATIRHNRARGKHKVSAMSDIVLELKRRNWSDVKIGRELGMDPDEVLRLTQITGLAEMFSDRDFSEAWDHTGEPVAAVEDTDEPVDLEWMNETITHPTDREGWVDRSEQSSILYGAAGRYLALIQKSRFRADEWFVYVYTAPTSEARAESKAEAQMVAEGIAAAAGIR